MGMISRVKSYAGHRAREALLYPAALMPRRAPRIMFFPSSTRKGNQEHYRLRLSTEAVAARTDEILRYWLIDNPGPAKIPASIANG